MLRTQRVIILLTASLAISPNDAMADVFFEQEIAPLLRRYCVECHSGNKSKGEFNLDAFQTADQIRHARRQWLRVLTVVREEEMPPQEPLPTAAERQTLVNWLQQVTTVDWSKVRNPGHVTIPRLTREEYNNTMRDLLGIDLRPAQRLSQDGEGNSGFNTDRDALFMTATQMDKYLEAAERALDGLLALRREPMRRKLESENMFMTETRETPTAYGDDFLGYVLNRGQMTLYESVAFPADGYYEFRIRARSTAGPTGTRLRINDVTQGDFVILSTTPAEYSLTTFVPRGSHQIAFNIQQSAAANLRQAESASSADQKSPVANAAARAVKSYTKLPDNASRIVDQQSGRNYPRYPLDGTEDPKLLALIRGVDQAALSVQRPYEWLRLHGADGNPAELRRFTGYVADRSKKLEEAKDAVAAALQQTRTVFNQRYQAANAERLANNQELLRQARQSLKNQPDVAKGQPPGSQKPGHAAIDWVSATGPVDPRLMPVGQNAPETDLVFVTEPSANVSEADAARTVITHLARRAFRRPVQPGEVDRFFSLYQQAADRGSSYEQSVRLALTAILVSPKFLYRLELGPKDQEFQLEPYQLASRLSYFLWMSMPDETLFELAGNGQLRDPEVIRQQIARMLADPRAEDFARGFTGQWLGIAALGESVLPDGKKFPEFSEELAAAMKRETSLVFLAMLREEDSVLKLLDSDETWLNTSLARHYGIKEFRSNDFVPVALPDRHRGGLLGMGSVLTATSGPTRTSPVVRGRWVLETLLGRDLPEPPADAGELPGDAGEARSLREELLLHRRNPSCAACHDKIDPIGFGLENFDAIGRFRTTHAGQPIDARGELPGGIAFDGPVELKAYLVAERKTEFTRNLACRLLSFSLGRALQEFDEPVVDRIVAEVARQDFSSRVLLEQIILSLPFQYQSGQQPDAELIGR